MKQIRCSNGCSLDVKLSLSFRQSYSWGISLFFFLSFSPATRGYWTCLAPLPLLSLLLRGQSLDMRQIKKKSQQNPTLHCCNLPHRHECVRAWGVKAPCLHSLARGRDPTPLLSAWVPRPGPFLRSVKPDGWAWEDWRKGGAIVAFLCGDSAVFQIWLKGGTGYTVHLPTSSLAWPWRWPLSQLSILSFWCLKATE